eukprot:5478472-Prymnesium_polylepis.1
MPPVADRVSEEMLRAALREKRLLPDAIERICCYHPQLLEGAAAERWAANPTSGLKKLDLVRPCLEQLRIGGPRDVQLAAEVLDTLSRPPAPAPAAPPPPKVSESGGWAKGLFKAVDAEAAAAESAEAAAAAAAVQLAPEDLVGHTVRLHGLGARPELNGRHGRAMRYDAEAGRVAVVIKDVGKMAIKPSNLTVEDEAPRVQAARVAAAEQEHEWSWAALLRRLSLTHLRVVPWKAIEGSLFTLVAEEEDAGVRALLEKEGVHLAGDVERLLEEFRRPVPVDVHPDEPAPDVDPVAWKAEMAV